MGRADFLALGDWNVVCFQCGFKRKASMMERNWRGYYVCPEHNEPRQPQDFARGVPDDQIPPWVQPTPSVVYSYNNVFLGITNGVTVTFQLGDGLYPTQVTNVKSNDVDVPYTDNGKGEITITTTLTKGSIVTASGSETMS